jgi:hypothetical protein
MRPGWREHPCGCHASRASSEQDQIGSRRTGAAHFCGPLGVTIDAHYPDPFGSDTLCRELVDHRLERPIDPGAFAPLPSPPWTFQSIAGLLSRGPLCLPTCFRWPVGPKARFPRSPAKRTAIHGAKVSSISEEHLQRGRNLRPVTQAKLMTTLEGGALSTGCSQPVDKGSAPCFIPLHTPLLTKRGRARSWIPGDNQLESRYAWPVPAAPSGLLRSG